MLYSFIFSCCVFAASLSPKRSVCVCFVCDLVRAYMVHTCMCCVCFVCACFVCAFRCAFVCASCLCVWGGDLDSSYTASGRLKGERGEAYDHRTGSQAHHNSSLAAHTHTPTHTPTHTLPTHTRPHTHTPAPTTHTHKSLTVTHSQSLTVTHSQSRTEHPARKKSARSRVVMISCCGGLFF